MELISSVNPYFKNWYDLLMSSFSLESDFLKDFFIDGWYIPGDVGEKDQSRAKELLILRL
jgi:hypothetical protein